MEQNFIKSIGLKGYLSSILMDSTTLEFCFDLSKLEEAVSKLFNESGIVDHYQSLYSNLSSDKLLANELDRYIDFVKAKINEGSYKSSTTFNTVVDDLDSYVVNRTIELHRYTNGGPMTVIPSESSELTDILIQDFVTLLTYYFNITGISDYLSINSYNDEEAYNKSQQVIDEFREYLRETDETCDIAMVDMYAESWFKEYYRKYCWR